jgi:hypothetical protein
MYDPGAKMVDLLGERYMFAGLEFKEWGPNDGPVLQLKYSLSVLKSGLRTDVGKAP